MPRWSAGCDSIREKVLLDPYGRAIAKPAKYSRVAARKPGDNCATAIKSAVTDVSRYDWEGDEPLRRPFSRTVIYEMHVAGFTKHPNSSVAPAKRGKYSGLVDKIPYLRDLGVTAVELLPVFEFDEQDAPCGLTNHWGYSPVSFFSPHSGYSSRSDPLAVLDEFRDMVKALHRAGIEVILDVVYNHSAEGGENGPTLCFKGFANEVYYILDRSTGRYANYTGTGNTLNANEPFVRRLIRDSLHYWVEVMHVDGFRFDLASIFSRDESGRPLAESAYPVGHRFGSWAGRYQTDRRGMGRRRTLPGRHIHRGFLEGMERSISRRRAQLHESGQRHGHAIPYRLFGSPDIYGHAEREPEQSINFVTCHDGFTLNDLLSYNVKHNEAQWREQSRWYGCQPELELRCRGSQRRSSHREVAQPDGEEFSSLTLLAVGTPMLLMGDEVRRTQRGNNNAYCQDNEISWFDWSLLEKHRDIHRFVKILTENCRRGL